ncbi:Protein CBG26523 [Caenorhabditis briggsae]|uniref:Protein CBG26523 n=1 Tax=Caenorhabditis briggsae TaxID=6238 RepID=B6IJ06_CAEBR|nr:Protein CBG26523 [Caenorhabditis briggsae]CAR99886.1 Protein CBG26523 [Caenorhabditis briggsae]
MSQKEKKGAGVDLFKVKLEPPSLDSEQFGGSRTIVTQGDDKDSTRHTIEVLLDIS